MKIKCPKDGSLKEPEECIACSECYPPFLSKLIFPPNRKRTQNGKPRFGVGRLVKDCQRMAYYELVEEVVHEPEKMWMFSRGHAIHEFFQKNMPKEDKEVFISADFPAFSLIGFVDAIHDGVMYEFKTVADIPAYPQTHHVLQVQGYYSMLSPEQQAKVEKIKIVYASLKAVKTFEIPKRNVLPFLEARGTQLAIALKDKKVPPANAGWLCTFCQFRELCEKEGNSSFGQQKLEF